MKNFILSITFLFSDVITLIIGELLIFRSQGYKGKWLGQNLVLFSPAVIKESLLVMAFALFLFSLSYIFYHRY